MRITKLTTSTAMFSGLVAISAGLGMVAYQAQAAEQSASKDRHQAEAAEKDLESLQGTWILTQLDQADSKPTDEEKRFLETGGFKVNIKGNQLTLQDGSIVTITLDTSKQPKRLDWQVISKGEKKTAPAIYSLDADKLRICVGRHGDQDPPESFDVKKAAPGKSPTCWHLTRGKAPVQKSIPEKK